MTNPRAILLLYAFACALVGLGYIIEAKPVGASVCAIFSVTCIYLYRKEQK